MVMMIIIKTYLPIFTLQDPVTYYLGMSDRYYGPDQLVKLVLIRIISTLSAARRSHWLTIRTWAGMSHLIGWSKLIGLPEEVSVNSNN